MASTGEKEHSMVLYKPVATRGPLYQHGLNESWQGISDYILSINGMTKSDIMSCSEYDFV